MSLVKGQVPDLPVIQDAVSIDRYIYEMGLNLTSKLPWLSNGFGRAYRNLKTKTGGRLYVPEVYLGKKGNNYNYHEVHLDNDIMASVCFYVRDSRSLDFGTNVYNYYLYDVAMIFNCNLELINAPLLESNYFQENLIQDVLDVLTRKNVSGQFSHRIDSVKREFRDVYLEFDVEEQPDYNRSPMTCFRIEGVITLQEDCKEPIDTCDIVKNNLSKSEKICILQSIDFADQEFIDALSEEQKNTICGT